MKKIGYYIVLLGLLLASCNDDFLDTKSPSQQSSEDLFTSTFFTDAALNGIYSSLTDANYYGGKVGIGFQSNSDIEIYQVLSARAIGGTNDEATSNYYASSVQSGLNWSSVYRVIEMSSAAVEGIRKSPLLMTKDSSLMKAYLGEALTIRALAYFDAVKYWGDVPFKTTTTTIDNAYVPKSDRDTVYKYILKDLMEAQGYLPWMGQSIGSRTFTAERMNKGFAKGLAARVALFAGGWSLRDANQFPYQHETLEQHPEIPGSNGFFVGRVKNYKEYYAIAAQQCAGILGDSKNPHQLDDYENVWMKLNGLQLNPRNENLYEVAFGMGQNGDIGNLMGVVLSAGTSFTNSSRGLGGSYLISDAYYFYSFDSLDVRRDVTLSNISYTSDGYYPPGAKAKTEGEKFNNTLTSFGFAKWRYNWMTDAYLALVKASQNSRVGTGINWTVMRYSDIYLMFAEAMNELYGPDQVNSETNMSARTALEKVRERAFKGHPGKITAYSGDFFDAIMNERAWEFGGESLRKYDLVRWGLLSKQLDESKRTMCLMANGNRDLKIFDKVYPAGTLPTVIYYKYEAGKNTIDRSSINWYNVPAVTPSATVYNNSNWLNAAVGVKNVVSTTVGILASSGGLDRTADYSQFISTSLDSVNSIQNGINQYKLGNGVCNYRYLFPVYFTEVQNSNGAITNSYGY